VTGPMLPQARGRADPEGRSVGRSGGRSVGHSGPAHQGLDEAPAFAHLPGLPGAPDKVEKVRRPAGIATGGAVWDRFWRRIRGRFWHRTRTRSVSRRGSPCKAPAPAPSFEPRQGGGNVEMARPGRRWHGLRSAPPVHSMRSLLPFTHEANGLRAVQAACRARSRPPERGRLHMDMKDLRLARIDGYMDDPQPAAGEEVRT
jgi:hypothetical protein